MTKTQNIISKIEAYLKQYIVFPDESVTLPLALFVAMTYCWYELFDMVPYVQISARTKQSGKTQLLECLSFTCSNSQNTAAITPSALFHCIEYDKPCLFSDEVEALNSESARSLREILNVGYRRGAKIKRMKGHQVLDFNVYCPKVFALIGDVYDTLRDRCILVNLARASRQQLESAGVKEYVYTIAEQEGRELREELKQEVEDKKDVIQNFMLSSSGITWLRSRDRELWTPLFAMCAALCPERREELVKASADIAVLKTSDARSYKVSQQEEEQILLLEYAEKLLLDMQTVLQQKAMITETKQKHTRGPKRKLTVTINIAEALEMLKALPTAPWRKYKGTGLEKWAIGDLMSRMNCSAKNIRFNDGVQKGWELTQVQNAVKAIGGK